METTILDSPPSAPDLDAYIEYGTVLSVAYGDVQELVGDAAAVNTAWDQRESSYGSTVTALSELRDLVVALADRMQSLSPPPGLEGTGGEIGDLFEDLTVQAERMIEGLQANDDGSARREALSGFEDAARSLMTTMEEAQGSLGTAAVAAFPYPQVTTTLTSNPAAAQVTTGATRDQSQNQSVLGTEAWLFAGLVGAAAYALGRRRSRT